MDKNLTNAKFLLVNGFCVKDGPNQVLDLNRMEFIFFLSLFFFLHKYMYFVFQWELCTFVSWIFIF